jgi:hypothetical protein
MESKLNFFHFTSLTEKLDFERRKTSLSKNRSRNLRKKRPRAQIFEKLEKT